MRKRKVFLKFPLNNKLPGHPSQEKSIWVFLDITANGCNKLAAMERKKHKANFVQIGGIIDDIVGDVIAQNAKPAAFKGKVLLVHASSSTWIHQLQFLKQDMISKLNGALGKALIEDLKFKIGPIGNE